VTPASASAIRVLEDGRTNFHIGARYPRSLPEAFADAPVRAEDPGLVGAGDIAVARLHTAGYDWEFVPEAGQAFRDAGSGPCHRRPPIALSSARTSRATDSTGTQSPKRT
jgi:hypothetical protein